MFRDLRADEIECRVAQANQNGVSLLLYKDARCDQNILDETVGPMNWMRSHCRENANCIVSLWDEKKQQWISKEDTGTESNTEKEKGLASDSFKRACFNWGIGRELYTAPFIWIPAASCEKLEKDDKSNRWKCNDKFDVATIAIDNKKIIGLSIRNSKTRKVVYTLGECPSVNDSIKKEQPTFNRAEDVMPTTGTPTETFFCDLCGKMVEPAKKRDGSMWEPKDMAVYSRVRFGKCLCADCMKAESKK